MLKKKKGEKMGRMWMGHVKGRKEKEKKNKRKVIAENRETRSKKKHLCTSLF